MLPFAGRYSVMDLCIQRRSYVNPLFKAHGFYQVNQQGVFGLIPSFMLEAASVNWVGNFGLCKGRRRERGAGLPRLQHPHLRPTGACCSTTPNVPTCPQDHVDSYSCLAHTSLALEYSRATGVCMRQLHSL